MSELSTVPATVEMATTDVVPVEVDMTAQLPSGGSVTSPVCTLTAADGTAVILADDPVVAGNVVTQTVRGSALTAGQIYRLRIAYTAAVGVTFTTVTGIVVPL